MPGVNRRGPRSAVRRFAHRSTSAGGRAARNQSASDLVRLVATIGSPLAMGTAFLFYFGWVRAREQARYLGFDSSIMDLSTVDYVLDSIDVLYIPLILLILAAVVLGGIHERLVVPARDRPRQRLILSRAARPLRWSWLLWVPVGIVLNAFSSLDSFAIPFGITLSLVCAMYGRSLQRLAGRVDPWTRTRKALVLSLLVLVAFWDVERVARGFGTGYAELIVAQPQRLASVTVYSANNLAIRAPGVVETKLHGPDPEYRYEYTGLRLLRQSDGKYFMINERWAAGQGRVFVIRESDRLRIEFLH